MNWRIKKINKLESKKLELEMYLFMSDNFDEMFDIKVMIDDIQREIDNIERDLEKENK